MKHGPLPVAPRRSAGVPALRVGVSILAGGLSSRMGRDKARVRLGGRSMLAAVRAVARASGHPSRVMRRDLVPRCGPIGGVQAGLKTSRADAELFLACDMPFVSPALLARLVRALRRRDTAVFSVSAGAPGFPFLIRVSALPIVERQIALGIFSLRGLALALRARRLPPPPRGPRRGHLELMNINTPEDLDAALKTEAGRKRTPRTSTRTERS